MTVLDYYAPPSSLQVNKFNPAIIICVLMWIEISDIKNGLPMDFFVSSLPPYVYKVLIINIHFIILGI